MRMKLKIMKNYGKFTKKRITKMIINLKFLNILDLVKVKNGIKKKDAANKGYKGYLNPPQGQDEDWKKKIT